MTSDNDYIEVAVALPVHHTFTYSAPESFQTFVAVGKRVLVPFGRRRVTGYIFDQDRQIADKEIKPILDVLDEQPLFPSSMVPFFRWIADYYKYPVGEVVKNALPGGLNVYDYTLLILTDKGRDIALEIIRHHRLLELFLHEVLNYPWDEVDEEADKLEHVISEKFEDRNANALGNPEYDPHGDPIPAKDLSIPITTTIPLSTLRPGQSATIKRVRDNDSDLLKYLQDIDIVPESTIKISDYSEFDGNLHIYINNSAKMEVLGPKITNQIFVEIHN